MKLKLIMHLINPTFSSHQRIRTQILGITHELLPDPQLCSGSRHQVPVVSLGTPPTPASSQGLSNLFHPLPLMAPAFKLVSQKTIADIFLHSSYVLKIKDPLFYCNVILLSCLFSGSTEHSDILCQTNEYHYCDKYLLLTA